ncbi:MAG: hypothetical protein ACODAB_09725 [Gemmatimonadota bacterium]
MPQLHLYVPEELASEITRRAEALGMSISRFLAEVVRRDIGSAWPEGYFEDVIGGWRGEPLERAAQLDYEERASL